MDLFDAILKNQPTDAEPHLRAWGVRNPQSAFDNLRRMSFLCLPSQFGTMIELLGEITPRVADPDRAINNLERFSQRANGPLAPHALAMERPFLMEMFVGLFGYSQFAADFLVRYPHYAAWLGSPGLLDTSVTRAMVNEGLKSAISGIDGFELRQRAAIRWLRSMMVLFCARVMLTRMTENDFMLALSHCAAELIARAIIEAEQELKPRFGEPMEETGDGGLSKRRATYAAIAMGKLGAYELNFSSDIDLQFIYSAEGQTTGRRAEGATVIEGRITNHDYFCRLTERVVAFLGSTNDEGYLFRVDLRLRPDGEDGPIARSLPSFETYHETQARPWERMALIKGHAIAGEAQFCERFDGLARALVFDRALGLDIVKHIRELKWKIDAEVATGDAADREIKRGAGGIREIEFYVQALQLIHGPQRKSLRKRPTQEVILELERAGLIQPDEAEQMREDYRFLRIAEHRLQMMDLRQTHTLPTGQDELRTLARRCGFTESETPELQLIARWNAIRGRVHTRFEEFFGETTDQASDSRITSPEEQAARLIMAEAPERDIIPSLQAFGLESAHVIQTLRRLGGMGRTVYLTEKGREIYGNILPRLIKEAAASARPEAALRHIESFAQAFGSYQALYEIFDSSPSIMKLLLRGFGIGNEFAATLTAHPEYMDYFFDGNWMRTQSEMKEIEARIRHSFTKIASSGTGECKDVGPYSDVLAKMRRLEHLRIGMAECAKAMTFEEATRSISSIADASATITHERACELFEIKSIQDSGLAILAMGKLGTRELNYHSDLDLIYCRSDHSENLTSERWDEKATTAAAWITDALTHPTKNGEAFNVDVRLRPEGAGAPLAPNLSRYLDYYSERAELWELQSLLKVRICAGDHALGESFINSVASVMRRRLQALDLDSGIVSPIRTMRRRLEESAKAPRWILCDFKKGFGGLMDLEFLAQAHQLSAIRAAESEAAAKRWMGLRSDETFLACAVEESIPKEDAERMALDYICLRRLESGTRLILESEKSQIPAEGENWEAIKRYAVHLFGHAEGNDEEFKDALLSTLRENRARFDRLMPKSQ